MESGARMRERDPSPLYPTPTPPTFPGSKEIRTGECIQLFCLLCCRVVDDEILLTMDDGRSALKALELDGKEVTKPKYCSIVSVPITFAWGLLRNQNVQKSHTYSFFKMFEEVYPLSSTGRMIFAF